MKLPREFLREDISPRTDSERICSSNQKSDENELSQIHGVDREFGPYLPPKRDRCRMYAGRYASGFRRTTSAHTLVWRFSAFTILISAPASGVIAMCNTFMVSEGVSFGELAYLSRLANFASVYASGARYSILSSMTSFHNPKNGNTLASALQHEVLVPGARDPTHVSNGRQIDHLLHRTRASQFPNFSKDTLGSLGWRTQAYSEVIHKIGKVARTFRDQDRGPRSARL